MTQPKNLWLWGCAFLLLGGCSQDMPQINVMSDSFCTVAKKRTWSVNDTPETIEQIVKHNAGIDRACGIPKPTS